MMNLEIVVDNIEHFNTSINYKLNRIEICSALDLGGVTPDYAFVDYAKSFHNNIQVLIRPRQGNFIYSEVEKSIIEKNIKIFAKIGIKGVVFGALDSHNEIDYIFTHKIASLCKDLGLEITFNRAFDFTNNFIKSIDILESLNFNRFLSAGCITNITNGYENFKKNMASIDGYKIGAIAAGSLGIDDVKRIINDGINVESIHFQVRKKDGESTFFGNKYVFNDKIINEINKLLII